MSGPLTLALDIGGTKTAAALVTEDGALLDRRRSRTPAAFGADAVMTEALGMAHALTVDHAPVGVGIGSAGVIDTDTGTVRSATDALPGWAGTDLRGTFHRELGLPVSVANDVHTHALGEHWQGAARDHECVLFVAAGTGVGGALLIDGAVHIGVRSAAGHLGHVPVPEANGLVCPCGANGHVEAVASGPALVRAHRLAGGQVTRLEEVVAAADRGDPSARAVLASGARSLGTALAGAANVLDPDLIVLGGGVTAAGEHWWPHLRQGIADGTIPALRGLPVAESQLGADAALLGAARLVRREQG